MEENKVDGLFRNAIGHWVATHKGQRITFTEQRFGDDARALALRALRAMESGTYDELKDNELLKIAYSRDMAAKMLGISAYELNTWLLSGVLRGQAIRPPKPDSLQGTGRYGNYKFTGYEVALAQERMKDGKE
ncbi:MAG: hypothetical protein ACRC9H_15230 [Aeromonas veronii]